MKNCKLYASGEHAFAKSSGIRICGLVSLNDSKSHVFILYFLIVRSIAELVQTTSGSCSTDCGDGKITDTETRTMKIAYDKSLFEVMERD